MQQKAKKKIQQYLSNCESNMAVNTILNCWWAIYFMYSICFLPEGGTWTTPLSKHNQVKSFYSHFNSHIIIS